MRILKGLLYFLFAMILGVFVSDSIRVVVQVINKIPTDHIGSVVWAELYFWSAIGSLFGTLAVATTIALLFKEKFKVPILIYGILVLFFWIFFTVVSWGLSKKAVFIMTTVGLLSLPLLWFAAKKAAAIQSENKYFLNISWWNWLWVLPLYFGKAISILLFLFISLWQLDAIIENTSFFDFGGKVMGFIIRMLILLVIVGVYLSFKHLYSLISYSPDRKLKLVNFAQIFGHVSLIFLLWFALLGAPMIQIDNEFSNPQKVNDPYA